MNKIIYTIAIIGIIHISCGCKSNNKSEDISEYQLEFITTSPINLDNNKLPKDMIDISMHFTLTDCSRNMDSKWKAKPSLKRFDLKQPFFFDLSMKKGKNQPKFKTDSTNFKKHLNKIELPSNFWEQSNVDLTVVKTNLSDSIITNTKPTLVILYKCQLHVNIPSAKLFINDTVAVIKKKIQEYVCTYGAESKIIVLYKINMGAEGKIGTDIDFPSRDTCDKINHIKYKVASDGNGGFKFGAKIEDNSVECGYTQTTTPCPSKGSKSLGYDCDYKSHIKYSLISDGNCKTKRGEIIERNSKECGGGSIQPYTTPLVTSAQFDNKSGKFTLKVANDNGEEIQPTIQVVTGNIFNENNIVRNFTAERINKNTFIFPSLEEEKSNKQLKILQGFENTIYLRYYFDINGKPNYSDISPPLMIACFAGSKCHLKIEN